MGGGREVSGVRCLGSFENCWVLVGMGGVREYCGGAAGA